MKSNAPTCHTCARPVSFGIQLCEFCRRNKVLAEGNALTRDSILTALSNHIGARKGISIEKLVIECDAPGSHRQVRKLIEELRNEGHHICAHPSSGYFIAETAEELEDTCAFLYSRAMASLRQISAMKRIALPDLAGQLQLRT